MSLKNSNTHSKQKFPLWVVAGLVFVAMAVMLVGLTLFIDDTNFGTSNGLWKSVVIEDEMHHPVIDRVHEVANLVYYPLMGAIIKSGVLNPTGTLYAYQQLSIFNALMSAMALAAMFVLIYQLTASYFAAFCGMLFQLACAGYFNLSTTSEDVMPGFACMMVGLVFLGNWYNGRHWWHLATAAVFITFSWLFHWTLIVAQVPAIGLAMLAASGNWKRKAVGIALFLGVSSIIVLFFSIYLITDFFHIWFPAKQVDSGWIGWAWFKIPMLFIGMAQYVTGGFVIHSFHHFGFNISDGYPYFLPHFVISLFLIAGLAYCYARFLKAHWQIPIVRYVGIITIALFAGAQLMNVYEFGTDLQFHIQPMIWMPLAWAFMWYWLAKSGYWRQLPDLRKKKLKAAFVLLPLLLLLFNLQNFRLARKGHDTFNRNQIVAIEKEFNDLDEVFFITHGWDEFNCWAHAKWGKEYEDKYQNLFERLEDFPTETIADVKRNFKAKIDRQIAAGKRIIAGPYVLDVPETQILGDFKSFMQNDKLKGIISVVKNDYIADTLTTTGHGTFFTLKSADSPQ